jgi:hypothetical protein
VAVRGAPASAGTCERAKQRSRVSPVAEILVDTVRTLEAQAVGLGTGLAM